MYIGVLGFWGRGRVPRDGVRQGPDPQAVAARRATAPTSDPRRVPRRRPRAGGRARRRDGASRLQAIERDRRR